MLLMGGCSLLTIFVTTEFVPKAKMIIFVFLRRKLIFVNFCSGVEIVTNRSAPTVESNGCGSYGYVVPAYFLPVVTSCCDHHDFCYGSCGISKRDCDHAFQTCISDICGELVKNLGENSSLVTSDTC